MTEAEFDEMAFASFFLWALRGTDKAATELREEMAKHADVAIILNAPRNGFAAEIDKATGYSAAREAEIGRAKDWLRAEVWGK